MRPLTEPETRTLFSKLANYMGPSIKNLIAPPTDTTTSSNPSATRMSFRLGNQDRVYYCSEHLANLSTCVARENLLSVGTCLGTYCAGRKKSVEFEKNETANGRRGKEKKRREEKKNGF